MEMERSMRNEELKSKAIKVSRGLADFLCQLRSLHTDFNPSAGSLLFSVEHNGLEFPASNWNYAFAAMGLFAASRYFDEPYYEKSAMQLMGYLKTLQIFDPYHKEHYGAIREYSPQTPWCYTRDALSAAWGFLETYRYTGDEEYLDRAKLWAKWFLKKGLDDEKYPLFGVQFDKDFSHRTPHIQNEMQGSFQGGCLNFLYHLACQTGESSWTGEEFIKIADIFVDHIQQPDGFFVSVDRKTKKVSDDMIFRKLHRANDDLGTLGLLCAYRVTGKKKYLASIEKFMNAVFAAQREDGHFEDSVAPIPVVLNTLLEAKDLVNVDTIKSDSISRALNALFSRQCDGEVNPRMRGGLVEMESAMQYVTVRSSSYALIYLLKAFGGIHDYLTVETRSQENGDRR